MHRVQPGAPLLRPHVAGCAGACPGEARLAGSSYHAHLASVGFVCFTNCCCLRWLTAMLCVLPPPRLQPSSIFPAGCIAPSIPWTLQSGARAPRLMASLLSSGLVREVLCSAPTSAAAANAADASNAEQVGERVSHPAWRAAMHAKGRPRGRLALHLRCTHVSVACRTVGSMHGDRCCLATRELDLLDQR